MSNNFNDFTEQSYQELLQLAKRKWNFVDFTELVPREKQIVWRHDVDFSIHRAYKLAKIENTQDVKSIFFLQIGSSFYNLFEDEIKKVVVNILSLGHSIGLHFDPLQYQIKTQQELENKLNFEKTILETLFQCNITMFSFHNPTLGSTLYENETYSGMTNVYSKTIKSSMKYCSDSNGYWRYEHLKELLEKSENEKLHILTHPAWWTKQVLSPRDRVSRCIDGRAKKQHQEYDAFLLKHNRKNIKV